MGWRGDGIEVFDGLGDLLMPAVAPQAPVAAPMAATGTAGAPPSKPIGGDLDSSLANLRIERSVERVGMDMQWNEKKLTGGASWQPQVAPTSWGAPGSQMPGASPGAPGATPPAGAMPPPMGAQPGFGMVGHPFPSPSPSPSPYPSGSLSPYPLPLCSCWYVVIRSCLTLLPPPQPLQMFPQPMMRPQFPGAGAPGAPDLLSRALKNPPLRTPWQISTSRTSYNPPGTSTPPHPSAPLRSSYQPVHTLIFL
ncbi:hypothetical protein JZ751_015602 [Albula glossodonta]|uniref:Uncharacterized protein n=1 Tax=Albula glossodonta TaxID=121402 RepID=A0A8T2NU38_9TELE|nr:hypothetical protein JZ751_015602 [Albula glossodonta]